MLEPVPEPARAPVRVGVVADDLTGSADTAVQFATAGWPTVLALPGGPPVDDGPVDDGPVDDGPVDDGPAGAADGVVAVSTDARALGEGARAVTAAAVRRLQGRGASHLYLKVDSTLRGSVASQVAGALDALDDGGGVDRRAVAVVCPAYPAMGRTVVDGVALVGGRRLEEGPAGLDPVTPVVTSVLGELLPGAVHLGHLGAGPPERAGRALLAAVLAATSGRDGARVVTVDAGNEADLDVVAAAVAAGGPALVPVGSAGLAGALATRWRCTPPSPRQLTGAPVRRAGAVLVLVSSLHDVAREQTGVLRTGRPGAIAHLAPSHAVLADDGARARWLAAADGPPRPDVLVLTAPAERQGAAAAPGVAAALADVAAALHGREPLRAVVAVGGDGAEALVRRWGATGLAVSGALAEGVPHGVLLGGVAAGLPLATKAGGFGAPGTLLDVVRRLSHPPTDHTTDPRRDLP
ncbi:four-carbon acid sugar kinase family protein [Quadrisphaera sp. KR29]|uniref:four-carbon acid sugar kinase family protein n=1 Tax=Quadrisphaera sp. KR29 TaxID=3461391 RepID=UPI00404512BD